MWMFDDRGTKRYHFDFIADGLHIHGSQPVVVVDGSEEEIGKIAFQLRANGTVRGFRRCLRCGGHRSANCDDRSVFSILRNFYGIDRKATFLKKVEYDFRNGLTTGSGARVLVH